MQISWVDCNPGIEFPTQDPTKQNYNFSSKEYHTGYVCIFLRWLFAVTFALDNCEAVDHEIWSDQAQFWDEFGQFWELVDQFWELVDGEEGKSVSEPLPPLQQLSL